MFSQNEEANEIVDIDMLKISDAVGSSIDNFNISVILFGSYCKGEGGFVDGKLVNDYDLLLITDTKKEADDITEIILELGLQNKADIQWTTNEKIKNLPCTQQWYEIAKSGIAIDGEMPEFPDWEAFDIPYSDAIQSLEKRATSMILGKYEMLKGDDCNWDKVMTQIGKMIIALGDAILIKRGMFSPSYRTRALMLGQDNISQMYTTAVSHKLLGTPDLNKDGIWELWNMTRNYYLSYVTINKLRLPIGEAMLSIDETTPQDTLKEILVNLGSEGWLE